MRELIQNSLDAKQDGIASPVGVKFAETAVSPGLIGGEVLSGHFQSCLERAKQEGRPDSAEVYAKALSVVNNPSIPCLKIQDTGTTGLDDAKWRALVLQEGAVSKSGRAPGGSFGIGKNAVLNVSDLHTVFYSTRLVEGRRGRVEKWQGKATLSGHPDPYGSGVDLQHIGFYSLEDAGPVIGNEIPKFFRLDDSGAGVFIVGFNPHSSLWEQQVVTSVIENFFYAIHHQLLTVDIVSLSGESTRIDHQTMDYLFERVDPINRDAVHYYRAIRDLGKDDVEHTERLTNLGRIGAYVAFRDGAPRRIAHINRNGMLITDSREQKSNPLAPKGRSLWPDFVAVVVPDTDAGDLWLRRMENPSHNSLSSGQLLREDDRRNAERLLKEARKALGEIIDQKAEIDRYREASNVDELADIFPDQDGVSGTRLLATSVIESKALGFDLGGEDEESKEEVGEQPDNKGDDELDYEGDNGGAQGTKRTAPAMRSERAAVLQRVRYVPLSPTEAIIAFNPTSDSPHEVRLSLAPAGAERDPQHIRSIAIIEATLIGDSGSPLVVNDGVISFTADSTDRVTIKVVADGNLDQQAFRLR